MNQQVQQSEHAAKMQQLLAKCWTDEAFKKQMLTNPMAAMKAEGVEPPAGLTIKVVENTDDVLYLTIPIKPSELSDNDLDNVAGGGIAAILFGNYFSPDIPQQPGPNIPASRPDFFGSWKFIPQTL